MAKKITVAGLNVPLRNIETNLVGELITVGAPTKVSFDETGFIKTHFPAGSSMTAYFTVYEKDYIVYVNMFIDVYIAGTAIGSHNLVIKVPHTLLPAMESISKSCIATIYSTQSNVALTFGIYDDGDGYSEIQLITSQLDEINSITSKRFSINETFSFPKKIA